jgi:quinolinate synthase
MLSSFSKQTFQPAQTHFNMPLDTTFCQADYPLDWYQEEFKPYAEEYLALPDRQLSTVLNWMKKYLLPSIRHFGSDLLLAAHYYMGGDIVKVVEHFGGAIGDSYQLAMQAYENPEKKIIVESAVHFMAETISLLAHDNQTVYITNPKAGCTMEMFAKDDMVQPCIDALNERYGEKNIVPIVYINTAGRIKAMVGAQGGATCTSSNVKSVFTWALQKNKKILFIPDKNMGENAARWLNISPDKIAYWPCGDEGRRFSLHRLEAGALKRFDEAQLILFCSACGVHTYYQPEMVEYWQKQGFTVAVHPECTTNVVTKANAHGSTAFLWDYVSNDRARTHRYALGTESHFVQNARLACAQKGIEIVNLGDACLSGYKGMGCGCATMSRNDPPHLVGLLDLLRQGKVLDYNIVQSGDVVNEFTGARERLDARGQAWVKQNAGVALQNMIRIVQEKN